MELEEEISNIRYSSLDFRGKRKEKESQEVVKQYLKTTLFLAKKQFSYFSVTFVWNLTLGKNTEICPLMKWGSGPVIPILFKTDIRDFLFSCHQNPNQLKKHFSH